MCNEKSDPGVLVMKPANQTLFVNSTRPRSLALKQRGTQVQDEEDQRGHRARLEVILSSDQADEVFGTHRCLKTVFTALELPQSRTGPTPLLWS